MAEKIRKQTPIFRYFDPAGKPLEELSGKRATSKSAFGARVEALWKISFEKVLKEYVREMNDLLDRMDRLATEKQRIEDQITRADGNPQKVAALQKEAERLKTDENTIKQDEEKLLGSVTVRPEFKPAGDEKACR
jgi:cell shape-determining protein MreC